jgi:hypothetical protein
MNAELNKARADLYLLNICCRTGYIPEKQGFTTEMPTVYATKETDTNCEDYKGNSLMCATYKGQGKAIPVTGPWRPINL